MNYTPEMEKALQQSHGIGYAEYGRKLDQRIIVEKRRQQEYEYCKHMVAQLDSHLHK